MAANDHHDHDHGHDASKPHALALALGITLTFLIVEVVGGLLTDSLALLADAGHMATDVAALALALFAGWLARRPATPERSFGFRRAEVLAALLNAATLVVVSVYIFWEAFRRIGDPPHVDSGPMLAVAIAGLAANAASARVLSRGGGHQHDLNTRGAFLHVVGDLLGSVGAIGAAVTIRRRAGIWPIQSSRAASACSSSGARGDCFGKRWACRWNQRPWASTSRRCTAR